MLRPHLRRTLHTTRMSISPAQNYANLDGAQNEPNVFRSLSVKRLAQKQVINSTVLRMFSTNRSRAQAARTADHAVRAKCSDKVMFRNDKEKYILLNFSICS